MSEEHYKKCLETAQKLNMDLGLLSTLNYYDVLHQHLPNDFSYPDFKFENFQPPFGVLSEIDFTFSHINILLSGEYNPAAHNRLFNSKRIIDEESMKVEFERKKDKRITLNTFDYDPEQRQLYHPQHRNLWHVLLSTECATITEIKPEGPKITYYQAKIRSNDEDIVDKLSQQAQYKAPEQFEEYLTTQNYLDILQQKAYESVAWSGLSAGTKRFAAAAFLHSCPDKKFAIDIASKTGVYTRIDKDSTRKGQEILITHTIPQRTHKFPETQIPEEWKIGQSEQFLLHCVQYTRNNTYSLKEPWVDLKAEWIANPQDTNQEKGIKTNKIIKN